MASKSALDTLIELAAAETDEAAKRLGNAIRATDRAEKKLELLQKYRDEYSSRFEAKMAQGVSPMGYRNFQAFIAKLDEAIAGQQQVVNDAEQGVVRERGAWQDSERKRMSYDTLATRQLQQELKQENRRDQKLNDEYAARAGMLKRY
ncbi:MAG: flagellar export protein FliJ [Burkholderiaceae bacterium]|nr:flagellar export protein FliJ [Burkholderiaceae bacterium]